MAGVELKGDFAKLKKIIVQFEGVADPRFPKKLAKNIAEEAVDQVNACFTESREPGGKAWAPITHRVGQPLRDTGRLQRSIRRPEVVGMDVNMAATNVVYAAAQNYGVKLPYMRAPANITARPFFPEGTLPPSWEEAFQDTADEVLRVQLGAKR